MMEDRAGLTMSSVGHELNMIVRGDEVNLENKVKQALLFFFPSSVFAITF